MDKLSYNKIFEAITDDKVEAADLEFRSDLLIVLRGIFEANGWKQADIMAALNIPQPRASELVRGKIDKFSSDKLIGYLSLLGIRFKPTFTVSKSSKISIQCPVQVVA